MRQQTNKIHLHICGHKHLKYDFRTQTQISTNQNTAWIWCYEYTFGLLTPEKSCVTVGPGDEQGTIVYTIYVCQAQT